MAWTDVFTLKPGVDPTGVTAELLAALETARGLFSSFGQPFTVTSIREADHIHVQYNGVGTPLGAAGVPVFDLDTFFDDLGGPGEFNFPSGYQQAGISGGALLGLAVAGIAALFLLRQ